MVRTLRAGTGLQLRLYSWDFRDFRDSIFRSSTKSIFTGTVQHLFGCAENALKMLGSDVGAPQSGIKYRRINSYGWVPVGSNSRHLASLSYKKPTAAAVGTLETKRKFRRFILIIAVKFYFKMKTPTQKKIQGYIIPLSKYRLVNPNLRFNLTVRQNVSAAAVWQQRSK